MPNFFFHFLFLIKLILIPKVTTIPILISNNPISKMVKVIPYKTYFQLPYRIYLSIDRRFSNIKFNKEEYLKMARVENDLDIYYEVGNTNTQKQENEIAAIMKNRNSAG